MRIIHTSGQQSAVSSRRSAVSDRRLAVGGQQEVLGAPYAVLATGLLMHGRKQRSHAPLPSTLSTASRGFTMMELLVVVVIIGILAGMVLGALQMARQAAREAATKATITKLNNIIMQRYESYLTRRVPIDTTGMTPKVAATVRLAAIRDLMRMEMPERWNDISYAPETLPNGATLSPPPLHTLYRSRYAPSGTPLPNADFSHAKCLYLIVSMGNPEAMEQFNMSEIKVDSDGFSYFADGWGKPIYFLRWAPGCSAYSGIQVSDAVKHHDPFDTRNVDAGGYHLIPLIYSWGRGGVENVNVGMNVHYDAKNYVICTASAYSSNGEPKSGTTDAYGNITNHNIEQR